MARDDQQSKSLDRDELISLANDGKITSDEAEAEVAKHGGRPLAWQPSLPAFDPMQEHSWPLVMAVAWIAWRDLALVREQDARFRSRCTHWLFQKRKKLGEKTAKSGWFLEARSKPTVAGLRFHDGFMKVSQEFPPTRQMPVHLAEQALWRALSEGRLSARALNSAGAPVDIPERDWSYLTVFAEREIDVLKYAAADRPPAFTGVKFRREDLFGLWPRITYLPAQLKENGVVERSMIEPVASDGTSGFVPLCSALHWIMTKGGSLRLTLDDEGAWKSACKGLLPLIHDGKIDLLGLPRGSSLTEKIPGHSVALVKVVRPLKLDFDDVVHSGAQILCMPFIDMEQWLGTCNDELYVGRAKPDWTHLQVPKSQLLKHWPKPESRAKPELDCYRWLLGMMQQSLATRPKSKDSFMTEALETFPGLKERQFKRAWDDAISDSGADSWKRPGPLAKRSDQRTK